MSNLPPLAFLDGVALSGGRVCIIAADWGLEDAFERPTRLLFLRADASFQLQLPANIISVAAFCESDSERVAALSKSGQVFVIDSASGRMTEERIPASAQDEFTRLHVAAGVVLACGMRGLVCARRGPGHWIKSDAGLFDTTIKIPMDEVDDLAGTAPNDLYAVGAFGLIAHYDGTVWTRIDSPTDRNLEQAITSPSGEILICGDRGLLLHGRDDRWELIDTGLDEAFWGMAWFRERLYLATQDALYNYSRTAGLEKVSTGLDPSPPTYRLDADNDALWSFGLTDVLRFDGIKWQRIYNSASTGLLEI